MRSRKQVSATLTVVCNVNIVNIYYICESERLVVGFQILLAPGSKQEFVAHGLFVFIMLSINVIVRYLTCLTYDEDYDDRYKHQCDIILLIIFHRIITHRFSHLVRFANDLYEKVVEN